jgi:phosphoglycolate phosphatase
VTAPPTRGVLFDKDGTLLDFHATWMPAYRAGAEILCRRAGRRELLAPLLEAGGFDAGSGRCDPASPLACGTTPELIRIWAPLLGDDDHGALERIVEEVYATRAVEGAVPVTDLGALFERLADAGYALGVATNDREATARATLDRLGADTRIGFVCGADSGHGAKPGPGMARAFCGALGLEARHVVVVGDTLHDLDMGRAAGAGLVVGVLTGAATREALAPHADHVIADISALPALLERSDRP